MKTTYKILLSAFLLSASCFAFADSGTSSDKIPDNGVYIQGKAGVGTNGGNTEIGEHGSVVGFTPIVNLGYQFNRYFALEGRYQYLSRNDTLFGIDEHQTDNQVTANIKGILPFYGGFDAFATIGAGADFSEYRLGNGPNSTTEHGTSFVVPVSAGLDYNFNQHLAWTIVSVDVNVIHTDPGTNANTGIGSITTGLKYTF